MTPRSVSSWVLALILSGCTARTNTPGLAPQSSVPPGEVPHCPPSGYREESLRELQSRRFETTTTTRATLAVALLPCLADRDPFLRDDIATAALTRWLRTRLLAHETVRALGDSALRMLVAEPDTAGFAHSFAALILSEVVRADRLDSLIAPATLNTIATSAAAAMRGIVDYRGYDARDGWRHAVAHTADLILQLGVHPRIDSATVAHLLSALGTQVAASQAHVYLESETERFARAVVLIHARRLLPATFWDAWFLRFTGPGSHGSWGEAMQQPDGRARRHNVLSFLYAVGFAARVGQVPQPALAARIDQLLRAIVAL